MNNKPIIKHLIMLVALLFLLGFSCDRQIKPDPKLPTDSDQCEAACENLRNLGCEEGRPIVDAETGYPVTCEIFCLETQGKGHALNPTCVAKITKCEDLEPLCSER